MGADANTAFESPEVNARVVVACALGLALFVAMSLTLLGIYYIKAFVNAPPAPSRAFPAPRLETRVGQSFDPLRQAQTRRLHEYAWVDRKNGLVRIPVERAMELVAARGAKAYDPVGPPPSPQSVPP